MPGKRCDALSGHNRACVERQCSTLMTQGRPTGSEQKDFNVLIRCAPRRPDANLSTVPDLEICDVIYPDKGTFGRVLKYDVHFSLWGNGQSRPQL